MDSQDSKPPANNNTGLFHFALLYPTRKDLAIIYKRIIDHNYALTGVADHGMSEAIFLSDPDNTRIELYYDRPRELCPIGIHGEIKMFTQPLDVKELLGEIE